MKKKTLIITILFFILIIFLIGLFIGLKLNKKENNKSYDEPDASLACYYQGNSVDDSGSVTGTYTNYMFIYEDDNSYVSKVIYKSVYANNYFNASLSELTQSVLDLYSDINGISTSIETEKDSSIVTIVYDYRKINIKQLRKELKSILDEDSVLMNMKTNTTVDEYLKLEDSEYVCK